MRLNKRIAWSWAIALAGLCVTARAGTQDLTLASSLDVSGLRPAAALLVGAGALDRSPTRVTAEPLLSLMKPAAATRPVETAPVASHTLTLIRQVVDVDSMPWRESETGVVRFLAPLGWLQPFASMALESNDMTDWGRMGMGAGALFNVARGVTFGAEVLVFPNSDRTLPLPDAGTGRYGEVRLLARLQFTF